MYTAQPRRNVIECKDGFTMSVQASYFHYCTPRANGWETVYTSVEVGFPNKKEDLLMDWAEDNDNPVDTVYAYVPASIIRNIIHKHGGMVKGQLPYLDLNNHNEEE